MQYFFIVGAQKSGTTWLQRLLNEIPSISCFGESHFVDRLLLPCAQHVNGYNKMMDLVAERVYENNGYYTSVQESEFLSVMRAWFTLVLKRTAGENWASLKAVGDKTPAHSFHIPILQSLFPDAAFIHMLRDGRDATVSAYHHRARILTKLNLNSKLQPIGAEAPAFFLKWKEFTEAVLKHEQQGAKMHTIRYENLLISPQTELEKLLNFLLPNQVFSPVDIQFAVQRNSFASRSGGRQAGTVDSSVFLRQGTSGSWQKELDINMVNQWDANGLQLLYQLGYA